MIIFRICAWLYKMEALYDIIKTVFETRWKTRWGDFLWEKLSTKQGDSVGKFFV